MTMLRNVGVAIVVLLNASPGAMAETSKENAIEAGAKQLSSEEIAKLVIGNTVTARLGTKTFLFHYGDDNVISGKLIGGGWSDTGYYGVTDDNRICLSMSKDEGRLRCLTLLELGGATRKYNAKGDMTFELVEFAKGKSF